MHYHVAPAHMLRHCSPATPAQYHASVHYSVQTSHALPFSPSPYAHALPHVLSITPACICVTQWLVAHGGP
jgi:hypothetical protein